MKKITELDKKLPHPDPDEDSVKAQRQQEEMPTLRKLLKMIAINIPPKGVDESDQFAQCALKLRLDADSVDVEEAEFKLLFENVEKNTLGWPGHIHNYVLNKMRESKARIVDVQVKEKAAS